MKKIMLLILSLALGISTLGHAYTHKVYFSKDFLKADGKYSFKLSGPLTKSKSWRIRVTNGKPEVLLEGAVAINPANDIHFSPDNSTMYVDGKGWCYESLYALAIESKTVNTSYSYSHYIKSFNRCKGHKFEIDIKDGKLVDKI